MKVCVVLPTYNERENVEKIIQKIFEIDKNFHILFVDDNSPDGTGKIISKLTKKNPNIHLITHEFKEGIGPAYISGFIYCIKNKFDAAFQMDADLSHNPEVMPVMLGLLQNDNFIIGSRYVKGGNIKGWENKRKLLSSLGNVYSRLFLGRKIKDWTGGYNLWSHKILDSLKLDRNEFPNGYAFQIALKFKAMKKGFKAIEVPITFSERHHGKSKIGGGIINEAAVTVINLRFGK